MFNNTNLIYNMFSVENIVGWVFKDVVACWYMRLFYKPQINIPRSVVHLVSQQP